MTRQLGISLVVLALVGAAVAAAQPTRRRAAPPSPDPLVAVTDADPLELARIVARMGDAAVLARLDRRRPAAVRLAAIRACPSLRGPERSLAELAAIAGGRDPHLAPAAAQALLAIAAALDGPSLDRREVLRAELTPARVALHALAHDASARADLVRAAQLADAALAQLGVPPGAPVVP